MEDASFATLLSRMQQATNTGTDAGLARILEVSPQSVSDARRKGKIPPVWLVRIAHKYQVSLDWLFFGTGAMQPVRTASGQTATGEDVGALQSRIVALEAENQMLRGIQNAKDETLNIYRQAFALLEKGIRPPVADARSYAQSAPSMGHELNETPLPYGQGKP